MLACTPKQQEKLKRFEFFVVDFSMSWLLGLSFPLFNWLNYFSAMTYCSRHKKLVFGYPGVSWTQGMHQGIGRNCMQVIVLFRLQSASIFLHRTRVNFLVHWTAVFQLHSSIFWKCLWICNYSTYCRNIFEPVSDQQILGSFVAWNQQKHDLWCYVQIH